MKCSLYTKDIILNSHINILLANISEQILRTDSRQSTCSGIKSSNNCLYK